MTPSRTGWRRNTSWTGKSSSVHFSRGGDYEARQYKPDEIVVDNPPFSILAKILKFYEEHGIRFFLFAPTLTLFSSSSTRACAICAGLKIIYENGADVGTSFLTNLENLRLRTAPDLYKSVQAAADAYAKTLTKELPKYSYPDYVITSAKAAWMSAHDTDLRIKKESSAHIRFLDAQKETGKAIFGSGYLLSEKAAAEKAAATRWELSDREWAIVKSLK